MTVERILLRALSSVRRLEKLVIKRARSSLLDMPISGLRVAVLQPTQLAFLTKLHLGIDIGIAPGRSLLLEHTSMPLC